MVSVKQKPTTIDEYLASVKSEQRAALQRLRQTIRAVVPSAKECISYGIPAFRLNGRSLVFFGAWANHCSFYPGHDSVHARQTPAGNVGEEAGQSPRRRKRLLSHGKNRVMQPHWVQSRAIAQLSK